MKFLFVVCGRNCESQAARSLASIAAQSGDHDFRVHVVDDASTDRTPEIVKTACETFGVDWTYALNAERVGAMKNQYDAWRSFDADPDDIVIWVDLDDRLADDQVLNTLAMRYAQTGAWVTYGSYRSEPYSATCPPARAYPTEVVQKRAFRQWMREGRGIWHNHLRSMLYSVVAQITEEDCKDDNGEWWMTGPDMAVMLVALEIAGPRAVFLPDVLYCYESSSPFAEWRQVPDEVRANHQQMFARPPKVPVQPLGRPSRPVTVAQRESIVAARNRRFANRHR